MTRKRWTELFTGLLILFTTGCFRWQPVETYDTYQWQGDHWKVRVSEVSGRAWLLDHFEIRGDTLRGAGYDYELARDPYRRAVTSLEIPMNGITAIEERKHRTKQELMLYGGFIGAAVLTLLIAI